MNNYLVLLAFIIPALCQPNSSCYFPSAANNSIACQTLTNSSTCQVCNPGYGLLLGNCYPNCPANYVELMPSYCLSSSVVNADANFTLCTTTVLQVGGICVGYSGSTCTCGPPCPTNYIGTGCQCNYAPNVVQGGDQNGSTASTMFKFWTAFLACSIALFIGFIAYKIWIRSQKQNSQTINTELTEYKEMVTQRA